MASPRQHSSDDRDRLEGIVSAGLERLSQQINGIAVAAAASEAAKAERLAKLEERQEGLAVRVRSVEEAKAHRTSEAAALAGRLATLDERMDTVRSDSAAATGLGTRISNAEQQIAVLLGQINQLKWLIGLGIPLMGIIVGIILHYL